MSFIGGGEGLVGWSLHSIKLPQKKSSLVSGRAKIFNGFLTGDGVSPSLDIKTDGHLLVIGGLPGLIATITLNEYFMILCDDGKMALI